MRFLLFLVCWTVLTQLTLSPIRRAEIEEQDPAYFHTGELAASLRSAEPPPLFDADPQHLWNRLFAAAMIRPTPRLPPKTTDGSVASHPKIAGRVARAHRRSMMSPTIRTRSA